ncbi:DUF4249 domain-containing protein [Pontibacter sp. 172403-2]|uniref:DUF4249 domain-containing protein n=1 Tax=Pontibacter rufus TaxID=2791028 RepID=UPI0018AF85F7|nr:DUF4249 domain-containing protein [Pontibacter sp. 172403-2]MBF9252764.1 DUF4249 domain-containing protein [Pontibacter sp. 172403-2]
MTRIFLYLLLPLLLLLCSCDLQKDIEVELPPYAPQLVVECYLEPGQPFRLTVLESSSYFETPQPVVVDDAQVYITYNGKRTEVPYKPTYNESSGRLYTHVSDEVMNGKPGDVYDLEVRDEKGRKVTGTTTILPKVPIDTIEWKFNEKDKAYLLTSFQDNPNSADYYRYFVHQDSLKTDPDQNFTSSDNLSNNKRISYGSGFDYEQGDVVIVTLFHIEKQYYDFLNSTADARNANGNPFAQPAQIESSVQGGIGIFTNLAFDRKVVVIK